MSIDARLDEAITNAFAAIEPLIRVIALWPRVNAPAYAVVITTARGEPLRELNISDLPYEQWPAPFDHVARRKAALTARTGLGTRDVFCDRPDLLQAGDPKWFGSAIDVQRGLIVAASGGPEDIDDLIARTVLELIRAPAVLAARDVIHDRGPRHPLFDGKDVSPSLVRE